MLSMQSYIQTYSRIMQIHSTGGLNFLHRGTHHRMACTSHAMEISFLNLFYGVITGASLLQKVLIYVTGFLFYRKYLFM